MYAAQAAGCAPVVRALEAGIEYPEPVRPDTIAKSIAIGNPADGYQVVRSVRTTGGAGAAVSDEQIVDAIRLLAETEGIFTEPAGGHDPRGRHRSDRPRRDSARRVDRHLRDGQRLQDAPKSWRDSWPPPVRLSRVSRNSSRGWKHGRRLHDSSLTELDRLGYHR